MGLVLDEIEVAAEAATAAAAAAAAAFSRLFGRARGLRPLPRLAVMLLIFEVVATPEVAEAA